MISKIYMSVINHILKEKISYEDSLRIYELHLKRPSDNVRPLSPVGLSPVGLSPVRRGFSPVIQREKFILPMPSEQDNISHNPPEKDAQASKAFKPIKVDPVLEDNLLKLTETDNVDSTAQSNDNEDIKLRLLQDLMVCQNNIKQMTNDAYNKDIIILNLMKEKQFLEHKIYKDKIKANQLTHTIQNI
jgi:hypothetical protein